MRKTGKHRSFITPQEHRHLSARDTPPSPSCLHIKFWMKTISTVIIETIMPLSISPLLQAMWNGFWSCSFFIRSSWKWVFACSILSVFQTGLWSWVYVQGDEGETDSDSVVENLSCVEIDKVFEEVSQWSVKAGGDVERAVPFDVSSGEQSPVRCECIFWEKLLRVFSFSLVLHIIDKISSPLECFVLLQILYEVPEAEKI